MPHQFPRFKAGEVVVILRRHGFTLISQRGSHQKWRSNDTGKQVIVPFHKGRQLPLGTLRSIIMGSGIPAEDFHV
jgi:predicted RNA binding protein YcfA (HicA-like mRNA interferase family)